MDPAKGVEEKQCPRKWKVSGNLDHKNNHKYGYTDYPFYEQRSESVTSAV
jgi:hypothetical protein